jgi:hypothetical protein
MRNHSRPEQTIPKQEKVRVADYNRLKPKVTLAIQIPIDERVRGFT